MKPAIVPHRCRWFVQMWRQSMADKNVSGYFVWMDLLEKRAGKREVVRSAGSKVK